MAAAFRIGIDLGGTEIEAAALDAGGRFRARRRIVTPASDYVGTIAAMAGLVATLEKEIGGTATVGIGIPGTIIHASGLVKNANSTWLNGRPLGRDVNAALGRSVRFANDADCFALSEATDGAGGGRGTVFRRRRVERCGIDNVASLDLPIRHRHPFRTPYGASHGCAYAAHRRTVDVQKQAHVSETLSWAGKGERTQDVGRRSRRRGGGDFQSPRQDRTVRDASRRASRMATSCSGAIATRRRVHRRRSSLRIDDARKSRRSCRVCE
jgi:hypothetical protein